MVWASSWKAEATRVMLAIQEGQDDNGGRALFMVCYLAV